MIEQSEDEIIEMEAVQKAFKETFELFCGKAYKNDLPLMCDIHSAFGKIGGKDHNCLGCNFAESTELIKNFLAQHETFPDIKGSFPLFILSIYLLVERMEGVMDIVSVPAKFREKHFKVFQQVRKWANFVKHPKSFILVHHADYNFDGSGYESEKEFQETINDQFVTTYYKGASSPEEQKKINRDLYKRLQNKKDVLVRFPDPQQLVTKLCYSIDKFIKLITENQVYIEILTDEATIQDYFEQQNSEES